MKKVIELIFIIVFSIFAFLYVMSLRVSLKPFKITFESPLEGLIMLLLIAILTVSGIIANKKFIDGYKKGLTDGAKITLEEIYGKKAVEPSNELRETDKKE